MAYNDYTGATQASVALLTNIKGMLSELYTTYVAEIEAARDGESSLSDKFTAVETTITTVTNEVTNARDGEASLIDKINAIDTAIAAAVAGSGVIISSGDETTGFVENKILAGDNITFTKNNTGGDESMTISANGLFGSTTTSSAVDITLTSTSDPVQAITMTAAEKFVNLPDATGLTESSDVFTFFNDGDYRFGVKDSAGTFICSIAPKACGRLSLVDNSSAAGTWKATDGADLLMNRLKTVCNSDASTTHISSCKLTSTEVFVAWRGTDSDDFCAVLTDTGSAITVSNILEFDTDNASYISCCRMTDTVAIVGYVGTDSDGYCAAITYDGTDTLVVTDTHEFKDAGTISNICVVPIYEHTSSGKIGVFYCDGGASSYLYAQALNWTGTEITSNTAETAIRNATISYVSATLLSGAVDSASMTVSYIEGSAPYVKQVSWDGTTLTPHLVTGTAGTALGTTTAHNTSAVAIDSSYFVVFHKHQQATSMYLIQAALCYWSGTAISVQKSLTLSIQGSNYTYLDKGSAIKINSETILVGFVSALMNTNYTTYLAKIKAIGAASSHQCEFYVQNMQQIGSTGTYPNTTTFDENGGLCLYEDRMNSRYLTAQKIDIGD